MTSLLTEDPDKARRAAKRHRRAWHVFAAVEFAAWRHRERVADGPGGVVRVSDPNRVHAALFGRTMWTRSRTLARAYSEAIELTATLPRRVPWSEVPPGSAWIDNDGDVGLRWMTTHYGLDCGWVCRAVRYDDGQRGVDAVSPLVAEVELVAVGLSDADCLRVAKVELDATDRRVALAQRLAAKRVLQ